MQRRPEDPVASVPGLISYMQTLAEREKALLARELHDELGGLLVAASMDLAWLDHHLGVRPGDSPPHEIRRRLQRLKEALSGAVDIKRKIIEELRPTLLDNVGLSAALRWLVTNTCARAGLAGTSNFPQREPHLNADASIALFRIAQEGLGLIMESKWVRSISLGLSSAGHILTLSITGNGENVSTGEAEHRESYEFATIRHRVTALGGGVTFASPLAGEVCLSAWLPLEDIQPC
jgi:signal transduction histidine kinase